MVSIIVSLLLFGANCGGKKKGLLLLPPLAEGEGGPGVTPESKASENNDVSTQESTPSVEVDNNGTTVDTSSTNNTGNEGNTGSEPGVIIVPQPAVDDNSGKPAEEQPQPPADDNSGKPAEEQPQPPVDDNSGKPAEEQPQPPVDDDVAVDPEEDVVILPEEPVPTPEPVEPGESEEGEDEEEEVITPLPEVPAPTPVDPKCKAKITSIDTSKGRWYNTQEELLPHPKNPKKTIKAKGFHTYWQDQTLLVNINSDCDGGRYRLIVVAKNIHGPLPDFYKYFSILVKNETTGDNLGTFMVRASDKNYHRGFIDINLQKGENVLNILWKNDAWKKGEYDANIQIKRIALKKMNAKKLKPILSRKGSIFCDSTGRWYVGTNPPSVYTYWKDQTVTYCFRTHKSGKYQIRILARNAVNGLPLMPDYKEFKVLVASEGRSDYATIKADDKNVHRGIATLDLPAGDVRINITWLNDRYQPPKYDANIEITRVSVKRVGNVSVIANFLLQNPELPFKVLLPVSLLVLGAIGLITWYRYRKLA